MIKKLACLKKEDGDAFIVFIALILPILIAIAGLGADMSRVQAIFIKTKAAADASALAACSTSTLVADQWQMIDVNGNPTTDPTKAVNTSASHWYPEMNDAGLALGLADQTFSLNMANMTANQGVQIRGQTGQIQSWTGNYSDSYRYHVSAGVLTYYLGPALKYINPSGPDYTYFPISLTGTANVVPPS